jgi:pimeloyl-ACP methyl ester carboxylesterase
MLNSRANHHLSHRRRSRREEAAASGGLSGTRQECRSYNPLLAKRTGSGGSLRIVFCAVVLFGAVLGAHGQNIRAIRLTSPDDVAISGDYYPVSADLAPAVLLVHSFATNRDEWGTFPVLLQQNGIAVLAVDLRGHGESTRQITAKGPQLIDHRKFITADFQDMLLDINKAVDWLSEQPGINKQRIAIIGSSVGANLALRYTLFNDELAAEVLLSPGLDYKGIRTDDVMGKLGPMPLRIVVSQFDPFAFPSATRLMEIRKEAGHTTDSNELIVCSGSLHGGKMLSGVKNLPVKLLDWLKFVLLDIPLPPPPAPPPPAPPPATSAPPVKATPSKK